MTLVTVFWLFETICMRIFEYLLAGGSDYNGFWKSMLTSFETVETNDQYMLYLYNFVWFCEIFYISKMFE